MVKDPILEEIKKVDPLLHCPTQNLEQNLAEGIDEMSPDPGDVPGGADKDLTSQPNLEEADGLAIILQYKVMMLTKR